MWSSIKSAFFRYVPSHVGNPFALIGRMLRSKKRAATFTLFMTFLAILCIPLDLLLSIREKKYFEGGRENGGLPAIFICGPARSGTTLVYQVLTQYLDVTYVQNLTMLFPRSPITSTRIFRRLFGRGRGKASLENFYGKTSGLFAPSEANHVWNRGVLEDKTGFRTRLSDDRAKDASTFFDAFSQIDNRALVCKNNNLNVFADTVADAMPNSLFVCLQRDPRFLAQSLLNARRDIRGDISKGYGVQDVEHLSENDNPIKEICAQVRFLEQKARQMQQAIGPDRFWIIGYEEFCRNPRSLIEQVAEKANLNAGQLQGDEQDIESITVHNVIQDSDLMQRIEKEFESLTAKSHP